MSNKRKIDLGKLRRKIVRNLVEDSRVWTPPKVITDYYGESQTADGEWTWDSRVPEGQRIPWGAPGHPDAARRTT